MLSVTVVESAGQSKAVPKFEGKDMSESMDTWGSTKISKKLEALKALGEVTKLSSEAVMDRVGDSARGLV